MYSQVVVPSVRCHGSLGSPHVCCKPGAQFARIPDCLGDGISGGKGSVQGTRVLPIDASPTSAPSTTTPGALQQVPDRMLLSN